MSDTVIKVENVSKKFTKTMKHLITYGGMDITRDFIGIKSKTDRLRKGEFWALNDIGFELRKGETLGLIGANGSGKTTLLKLINGIFMPDNGKITVKGRVGALIAIGAGFHSMLTGRENVYVNGQILGMSKREIDKKFDEIVEFSEIGDFIDAPVKHYSSGMFVRLGFSVAVHCEPDILLIDEVLAVGDLSFRNKSMRKMTEMREKANAIVFISHNLEQVRNLCSRVIVLDKGEMFHDGDTDESIINYQDLTYKNNLNINNKKEMNNFNYDNEIIKIINLGIEKNNSKVNKIECNDPLIMYVEFFVKKKIEGIVFSFAIFSEENFQRCIHVISNDYKKRFFKLEKGNYKARVIINDHHLNIGNYRLVLVIKNEVSYEVYAKNPTDIKFNVHSDNKRFERGVIVVKDEWEVFRI